MVPAGLSSAARRLGLDDPTWEAVGPGSLGSGAAIALTASGLLALNRLGGLVVEAPRAFVRLTLVGFWGWVGLGIGIWLLTAIISRQSVVATRSLGSLQRTLAATGRAHVPLLVLAGVLFVAAGVLQLRWPGLIAAWFVVVAWIPISLIGAVRATTPTSTMRAAVIMAGPYVAWLATVGRHFQTQLGHLI